MTGVPALASLKRLLAAAAAPVSDEVCHLCGAALPAEHQHVADIASRNLQCICARCHATLPVESSGDTRRRVVPRRYVMLPPSVISDADWHALEIPVGIAFFFRNSVLDKAVACYPSPAGAIESLLPTEAWERVLAASSWTRTLAPDVEALLVRRTLDANESFIVPIDACYELAGRIRQRWSGFGGGPEASREIDSFFRTLRDRSERVQA